MDIFKMSADCARKTLHEIGNFVVVFMSKYYFVIFCYVTMQILNKNTVNISSVN